MKVINLKVNGNLVIEKEEEIIVPSGNLNSVLVKYNLSLIESQLTGSNILATFKRQDEYESYNEELETITIGETEYNNSCYIPENLMSKNGIVSIGIYAYEVDEENKIKTRVSCTPVEMEVIKGSFNSKTGESQVPDLTKYEEFVTKVEETKNDAIDDFDEYYEEKKATLKGDKGNSIQYNWDGTKLGVRVEGDETYTYTNLKGEKGDTGSIKFIIVENLPTTNIDTTAIYLKPTGNTENAYDEYIYVNNAWELLGQTQVEVDLTDYVKNTDLVVYATKTYVDTQIGTIETSLQSLDTGAGVE